MSNLIVRTISGTVFAAVMIACLLLHPALFAAVFLTVMVFSLSEFYHISIGNLFKYQQGIAIFTALIFFMTIYLHRAYCIPTKWIWLALVSLVFVQVSTTFISVNERREFSRFPYVYLGLAYIALPLSFASLIVFYEPGVYNGMLMICFFVIIWANDIGAYCIGTAFGQKPTSKKLAPNISPKKSWIGFWSGIVFAVIAGVVLKLVHMHDLPWIHTIVVSVIIAAGAVMGDLCESSWKRTFGVKDSGNCIPGHGGMLDRFDSTIVAIPLAGVYLYCFGLL